MWAGAGNRLMGGRADGGLEGWDNEERIKQNRKIAGLRVNCHNQGQFTAEV